ncbi:MAG TPA: TonB-dependent receptor [Casimicrobiaceae bacterium]|jgi:outer membrane receptor protein involved in Fe transport|nr:TonB-dependent receptor [Casimicrobiaceae bacterium]
MTVSGRNRTALSIVLSFSAALAHADGVPRIAPINVFGHYETAIGTSDAASAGYITPQLIDDRPLLRPGEVLEYVPGMIVTQHSGAGKANQYFLRGFNLDHGTDFATDLAGMPVNLRTHAHGQGYMDLNFMIPELVSRIDYYKGPYFAQQGDFATAGSASIHYAESLPNSLAELGIGTEKYGRALLAGSPEVGPGRVVYGVELYHDNGPWDNPDNYRKLNGVLRYTQKAGDGQWGVTAMGYSGKWNSTDQIPQRAVNSGLIDRLGAIDPSDGGRTYRYSLSGDYQQQVAGGQLQSTAYGIRYYLKLYSNFTYFLNDPVNGDQFNQYDNRKILGWNGSWTRPDKVFGLDMTNTLGWDIRQDRLDPVAIYNTVQRRPLSTKREDRVRETSYAIYAQNQTQWTDWLRTVAGVRGDRYDFKVDSNIADNSGSRSAGIGSPKLSMIFGPWQKTEYFVNLGEGFHSNDGRGTTTHVDPGTGAAVDPVTPLVRAKGAELGVRTEVVPNLQSSLSLWYLHLDSELVFQGDTGTDTPGRPSRRTGVEWSNHYTPNTWLLVDLDLAYTHARFADNDPLGNHIPEALQGTAEAGITVRKLGPWTASLFGRYFGPRSLLEDNSVKSKSTTLFNAQATYEVNKQLRLRFDVFNIFDRKADDITYYYRSRLPDEPAGGVNDIHFHPVERRSLRLAMLFKF